ncbi:MAG: succinate dehydrogenase cytochrome b subunit [Desulfobacterales bacterium]|nr:succinate dehydrogenase cytochrome b subunit [Desulfobacterales bacterium]
MAVSGNLAKDGSIDITSIGKKIFMAFTGLCFCGFLSIHLIGNLTIYGGYEMFNSYVKHLHAFDPLIKVAEIFLLTFAIIHITTGLWLFWENYSARPVKYIVKKNAGGRTIGSSTMPYTGLFLFLFIIVHLLNFHFIDKTNTTMFDIVSKTLSDPFYIVFYVIAVLMVAIHISHGFWSAFQTFGINHPKYNKLIKGLSLLYSIIIALGFGLLPIYFFMISNSSSCSYVCPMFLNN